MGTIQIIGYIIIIVLLKLNSAAGQELKLTYPNGGQKLIAGNEIVISWDGCLPADTVTLEYSTDRGNSWILITDSATGLNYSWSIPKTASTSCRARVTVRPKKRIKGMTIVSGWTFRMGNPNEKSDDPMVGFELPVHEVTISKPFYMGKYEVTQKEYFDVMGTNPSRFKDENRPVEQVSWYDAVKYCNKRSEKEGLEPCYTISGKKVTCDFDANGYRLPTEAEWEYVCSVGVETDLISGAITSADTLHNAKDFEQDTYLTGLYRVASSIRSDNHARFMDMRVDYPGQTHEVGQGRPNYFGIYNLNDNVNEYCWDWYKDGYYARSPKVDPRGPESGTYKTMRVGHWKCSAKVCRLYRRVCIRPTDKSYTDGFRIVRKYIE